MGNKSGNSAGNSHDDSYGRKSYSGSNSCNKSYEKKFTNGNLSFNYSGSTQNKILTHDVNSKLEYNINRNLTGYGEYRFQGNSLGHNRHDLGVGIKSKNVDINLNHTNLNNYKLYGIETNYNKSIENIDYNVHGRLRSDLNKCHTYNLGGKISYNKNNWKISGGYDYDNKFGNKLRDGNHSVCAEVSYEF